jgi:hypothetical protein
MANTVYFNPHESRAVTSVLPVQILPLPGRTRKQAKNVDVRKTRSIFFFFNLCGETLGTAATTGLLYHPRMIGDGDCGKKIG